MFLGWISDICSALQFSCYLNIQEVYVLLYCFALSVSIYFNMFQVFFRILESSRNFLKVFVVCVFVCVFFPIDRQLKTLNDMRCILCHALYSL